MRYIPNEVLDCIIEVSDEAALAALSCTSRQWRARVSCRQKWWRKRFEHQFLQSDDKESRWLRQYRRACTNRADLCSIADELQSVGDDDRLDWFGVYCNRRATEYRWRHEQYTKHRLSRTTDVRPAGLRLQSIPYVPKGSAPGDAVVASQWLLASQHSTWILEQLCWGDIEVEHMEIRKNWRSDEYLVVETSDKLDGRFFLYSWRLAALHKPPRAILADGSKRICGVDIRGSWLALVCKQSARYAVLVYDLAKDSHCSDSSGSKVHACILHATANNVLVMWAEHTKHTSGPATVSYQLWQITSNQAAPFQCQAVGKRDMSTGRYGVKPQRICDDLAILWSFGTGEPDPMSPPNLILLSIVASGTSMSLTEKWSCNAKIKRIRPLVAQNLLAVQQLDDAVMLLSLADGSKVHRTHIARWYLSGLYPLENQRVSATEKTDQQDPEEVAALGPHEDVEQVPSPTALLYYNGHTAIVFDYTNHPRQPTLKVPHT
ncbi:hypothetical protein THASP1DRAFT_28208 [Thamnocephalis sphaerospora]|uniref:F-box domain-containing protein n=1 Tax=Thamnocephalis sphaerospora TaxID=78915 RepID=A0A4P9XUU5_9FUNG|nr:hypothetical protein THASP1DRAFT_28208 [Thamnocephalis sphaerospora]|eukprot:RKP10024.1 hypothetical protein THASP1DRAFT_28208 [Thamnocephalis sphaerospora]